MQLLYSIPLLYIQSVMARERREREAVGISFTSSCCRDQACSSSCQGAIPANKTPYLATVFHGEQMNKSTYIVLIRVPTERVAHLLRSRFLALMKPVRLLSPLLAIASNVERNTNLGLH